MYGETGTAPTTVCGFRLKIFFCRQFSEAIHRFSARALRDSEIDFSDIPKLGKSFWATAKLTLPEPKDRLTIRVDHDVVQWLKKHGKGYQTRINAILRSYMEAQTNNAR